MIPPLDPIQRDSREPQFEAIRSVQAGGVHWHLRTLGAGPPLVLFLHGSASSGHAWRDVAGQMAARGWRCLIPDLPGHGESRGVPHDGRLSPDALSRALGALLRTEGEKPDLVVGHSVGAVLAVRAALRGEVVPLGILGVNPALGTRRDHIPAFLETPTAQLAQRAGPSRWMARLFSAIPLAETLLASTGSVVSEATKRRYRELLSDPARVQGVLRLQADWDAEGTGRDAIGLPLAVHFLAGARDRWVPLRLIERERAGVPLEVLPERGHLLPEEDPEAVVRAILALAVKAGITPLHGASFEPREPAPPSP